MQRTRNLFAILSLTLSAALAVARDPRATILIIGEGNTTPFGNAAPWPEVVQQAQPDWRIVTDADDKRLMTDFAAQAPAMLAKHPAADLVVVFLGTGDAAAEAYARHDAAAVGQAARQIIAAIKAAPPTAQAAIALCTPMPVIDARLDKWSTNRYLNGEAHCDAIAEVLRSVARDTGVFLMDVHAWAKAEKDDKGVPGYPLGTIGWKIRDWGHALVAAFFTNEFKKLNPQPPDPAAFAAWRAEQSAQATLEKILADTSGGIVAHGPVIQAQPEPSSGKAKEWLIDLPPGMLTGERLNLVFMSGPKPCTAIGNAANRPHLATTLVLTADGAEVKIPLRGADWQLLDEARGNGVVPDTLYRFNQQKMNYFGVTGGEAGQRRWCLARFDLAPLAGRAVTAAQLRLGIAGGVERMIGPDKTQALNMQDFGPPAVAEVLGQDRQWDGARASWRTRDGQAGWSGGAVNVAARRAALGDFLKTTPPPGARAAAQAALDALAAP